MNRFKKFKKQMYNKWSPTGKLFFWIGAMSLIVGLVGLFWAGLFYYYENIEPSNLIVEIINRNQYEPEFTLRKIGSKDILVKSIWLEVVNVTELPKRYLYPKICAGARVESFDLNKIIVFKPDRKNNYLENKEFLITDMMFKYSSGEIDKFDGIGIRTEDGFEYTYRFKFEWCELTYNCITKNMSSETINIREFRYINGFSFVPNSTKEILLIRGGNGVSCFPKEEIYNILRLANNNLIIKIILRKNTTYGSHFWYGGDIIHGEKILCNNLNDNTDIFGDYNESASETIKSKSLEFEIREIDESEIRDEFVIFDNRILLFSNNFDTFINTSKINYYRMTFFDLWNKSFECYP